MGNGENPRHQNLNALKCFAQLDLGRLANFE